MRIVVSGGGTGGHVYPVLTVLGALRERVSSNGEGFEALYVGGAGNIEERLAVRAGIAFRAVTVGGLRGLGVLTVLYHCLRLGYGLGQSLRILWGFRPDVVFSTGGYVCAPLVVAAWLMRCPSLIYLPDIEPGLAVRVLSRFVDRVAVSFEASRAYLPQDKVVVTGYPVRAGFFDRDKDEARLRLNLPQAEKVLLVLGGSRGAHSINVAVSDNLEGLVKVAIILHICGHDDWEWVMQRREQMPADLRERYRPSAYLHEEMGDALGAADLVLARAGAATMGEFPAVGLPAILVPYPHSGRHQETNAGFMVEHGVAVRLENAALREGLLPTILSLVGDERRLNEMRSRAQALAVPEAVYGIADEICRLASNSGLCH